MLRRRLAFDVRDSFGLIAKERDHLAHGHVFAFSDKLLEQVARFERFKLDSGFVGFDLGEDVAALHMLADLLQPRTSVPSVMSAPIWGMVISKVTVRSWKHREDGLDDVLFGWQCGELEVAIVRQRDILAGDAATGASSQSKACSMICAPSSPAKPPNFQSSSTTTARLVFFTEVRTVSMSSGRSVRRSMTSALISPGLEQRRRAQRLMDAAGVANDGHVGAFAKDICLAELDQVVRVVGHFALECVVSGVFDEDDRVFVAKSALEEALSRRRRWRGKQLSDPGSGRRALPDCGCGSRLAGCRRRSPSGSPAAPLSAR